MANKLVAASHSFFFFESNGCKSLIVVGFESMPSFLQKKKKLCQDGGVLRERDTFAARAGTI